MARVQIQIPPDPSLRMPAPEKKYKRKKHKSKRKHKKHKRKHNHKSGQLTEPQPPKDIIQLGGISEFSKNLGALALRILFLPCVN